MYKVHGTHHTRLDYVSVAPYDVKTLFRIDFGPLEMAFHFFSPTSAHGWMGWDMLLGTGVATALKVEQGRKSEANFHFFC